MSISSLYVKFTLNCICLYIYYLGALESADEGIGSMSPEHSVTSDEARAEMLELRRETLELRHALERERRHRIGLEEHIAILQQQLNAYSRKFDNERFASRLNNLFHILSIWPVNKNVN